MGSLWLTYICRPFPGPPGDTVITKAQDRMPGGEVTPCLLGELVPVGWPCPPLGCTKFPVGKGSAMSPVAKASDRVLQGY